MARLKRIKGKRGKRINGKYVSYQELNRRAAISDGVRSYWLRIKTQSTDLGLSIKKVRREFKHLPDINKRGIHFYLHKKKLPAGKNKSYTIAIEATDTKGHKHRTTIRGLGAKSTRTLKKEAERLTKVWLRANGLVMEKYRVRFKNSGMKFLRNMRLIIKAV